MISRRSFITAAAAAGAYGLAIPFNLAAARRQMSARHFTVHPFIERHPEAVFVMRTSVDVKTNSPAKVAAGLRFAQSVVLPADDNGIPVNHIIPVKPNLTSSQTGDKTFSLEYGMGIVTDPYFVEGVINGMKGLGISADRFHVREVNGPEHFGPRGYIDMCRRTGANIRDLSADSREIDQKHVNWMDVPDGYVHQKIPYLWPVNAKDTFYLNIAKFKSHSTGMTLCCKNHQGTVVNKYQRFCQGSNALKTLHYRHINPEVYDRVAADYKRHLADGYPRWEGLADPERDPEHPAFELWCQRTLDNLSATTMGLSIIEGIYGREGCFLVGPNPPLNNTENKREARDYMTNVIIFGKDPILVDVIGHWLAGHEPGQFGFFHLAMERGMQKVMDPRKIPVYRWEDGAAERLPLDMFARTPIRSDYIPKEKGRFIDTRPQKWYMYDEPFDYSAIGEQPVSNPAKPVVTVLETCMPHPETPAVFVEYAVPENTYVQLDVLDGNCRRIATPASGYREAGVHCAAWNYGEKNGGTWTVRLTTDGYSVETPIIVKT